MAFQQRGQFRSKIDGFRKAMPVWWCLQCNRPAGQERQRGKKTEMACSNCGSKGHYFPSTGEQRRYAHLMMLQNAGEISQLHLQVAFPVSINGSRFCVYRADFAYRDSNGRDVIEDYKGSRDHTDSSSALRRKAAELFYGITIKLVEA